MNVENKQLLVIEKAETDGGERFISGVATTPRVDRVGDIVEPRGAVYRLPLPLLHGHDTGRPIGLVHEARVDDSGIRVKCRVAKDLAAADEAWKLLQEGLLAHLSIGFRTLTAERIKGGGMRITKWDWLELSTVVIPACVDARLTVGKQMPVLLPALPDGCVRIPRLVVANDQAGDLRRPQRIVRLSQ